MEIKIDTNAIAICKSAGFHAAQILDGKLVAEFFGREDYFCVLRPDGSGHICIGPDELIYTPDMIYDVEDACQAIHRFPSVKYFTIKAMRDIQSREEGVPGN